MNPVKIAVHGARADFHLDQWEAKRVSRPHDAGYDLYPMYDESTHMALISHYYESLCTILVVSTGLHVVIPPGQFGRIEARSSTIQKLHGLMTLNDVIDANYTGEIKLRFALFGFLPSGHVEGIITDYAKSNIALAQLILYPVLTAEMYHAEELPVTDRGNQGFGSTDGIKVVHHE